ncbi:MAG: WbqC family protein [Planctomycetota bacterium]|nr:WbqC family protein [Planctomycetota bacterium]
MTTVAVLQSNYIPWKGYFDIINSVDLFVWYDNVQYTPQNWRNRNRIKTVNGMIWLTVPCNGRLGMEIQEVRISEHAWRRKHWASISQAYAHAPYFDEYRDFFSELYFGGSQESLSDLNHLFIERICRGLLGVDTPFRDASEFSTEGSGQERLLGILEEISATTYLSGPGGKDYIDPNLFEERGITIEWMDYSRYPEYPQLHGAFEHGVSILDLLFNVGPDASKYIWGPQATSR